MADTTARTVLPPLKMVDLLDGTFAMGVRLLSAPSGAGALDATAWVVANDAPATIKAYAVILQAAGYPVWVCDAVADDVQIQAAIDGLPAKGGLVSLSVGTFTIATSVVYHTGVSIKGQGWQSTILDGTGIAGGTYVIDADTHAAAIQNVCFADFQVEHGANGIRLQDSWNVTLTNIRIIDITGTGLYLDGADWGISGVIGISVFVNTATTGITIDPGHAAGFATINSFIKGGVISCTTGLNMPGAAGTLGFASALFSQMQIENCTTGALVGTVAAVSNVKFIDCIWDSNTLDLNNGVNSVGTSVQGGLIHQNIITSTLPLANNIAKSVTFTVVPAGYLGAYTAVGDFYCDGTADEVQINAAFTALGGTGGEVRLLKGTYTVAAAVIPTANSILSGVGPGTILTSVGGAAIDLIRPAGGSNYVQVRDMTVTGAAAAKNIIRIDGTYGVVENVIASGGDGTSQGIMVSTYGKILHCIAHDCGGPMLLSGSGYNEIIGGEVYASQNYGAFAQQPYGTIIGLYAHDNVVATGAGIFAAAAGAIIQGCQSHGNLVGIYVQSTSTSTIVEGNDVLGNTLAMVNGTTTQTGLIRNNIGHIAPGEHRTYSGALVAGNANAIALAWHNPEAQDVLIDKVVVEITTGSVTANSVIDVGIADDAAGTNRGVEFFDDLDANDVDINNSYLAGDGGTQTKPVFCQDSASATDGWIVGQILVADAAALAGKYYIYVIGR